jgi:uncharacterized damage-inducible protein DinB
MTGFRPTTPEEFVQDFESSAYKTARLIRVFDDADMSLRPGAGSMSTAEQINQIVSSNNFLKVLAEGEPPGTSAFKRSFEIRSVNDAIGAIRQMVNEVTTALELCPQETWDEVVEPFGPGYKMTRGQLAYMMLDHESHHRGQLTVYARVAGKVPPLIYDPVGPEVLEV